MCLWMCETAIIVKQFGNDWNLHLRFSCIQTLMPTWKVSHSNKSAKTDTASRIIQSFDWQIEVLTSSYQMLADYILVHSTKIRLRAGLLLLSQLDKSLANEFAISLEDDLSLASHYSTQNNLVTLRDVTPTNCYCWSWISPFHLWVCHEQWLEMEERRD